MIQWCRSESMTKKWWTPLVLAGICMLAACGYDSSLGEVECDIDTDCPDDAICEMGYCIAGERDSDCPEGEEECSGQCVDLSSSAEHCGGCGIECEEDEYCDDGSCVSDDEECEPGEVRCSGQCVDLLEDDENCGDCGVACGEDEYCDDGSCVSDDIDDCDGDEEWCDGQCVDLMSNEEHCGNCGVSCEQDQLCVEGICEDIPECEEGQMACGVECVDTMTDTDHCGGCGEACGEDQHCQVGQCVDECGQEEGMESFDICGDEGLCIDTDENIDHCGGCDQACEEVLGTTRQCVGGECVYQCDDADQGYGYCLPEDTDASMDTGQGQCFDLESDVDHCGGCDQQCPDPSVEDSDAYAECDEGQCAFQCNGEDFEFCGFTQNGDEDGFDLEGGECVDVQQDIDHCGQCDRACPDDPLGEVSCVDGSCEVECDEDEYIKECEDGVCVDTYSDSNHCGGCDTECGDDQICQQGECQQLPECELDPEAPFGGGTGQPGDPYVICDAAHLRNINAEDALDAHFVMVDHIDFDGKDPLEPIGQGYWSGGSYTGGWEARFEGHFDGHGFSIENLEIQASDDTRVGLFGFVGPQGTVENLKLVDPVVEGAEDVGAVAGRNRGSVEHITVENAEVDGNEDVGGVVGRNQGTVDDVVVENAVISGNYTVGGAVGNNRELVRNVSVTGQDSTIDGISDIGGLAGRNASRVDNSSVVDATVESTDDRVGGLVGYNLSTGVVTEASADATVEGRDAVGGLVGRTNHLVQDSSFRGEVVGEDDVGGLVGYTAAGGGVNPYQGQVTDSEVEAQTSVTGDWHVGGLVGYSEGPVTDSHSAATVEGHQRRVGGLIGQHSSGMVQGSTASGDVTGVDSTNSVGGLIGRVSSRDVSITDSHATGDVSGHGYVGGLVGSLLGTVTESSATGDVSASAAYAGGLIGAIHAEDTYWGYQQSSVSTSYAAGDVDASQSVQVGGFAGRNEGNIANSYALGSVVGQDQVGGFVGYMWSEGYTTGPTLSSVTYCYAYGGVEGDSDVGGLIGLRRDVGGYFMPEVTSSYWNSTDNIDTSDGGSSLTTDEFYDANNFVNWGFGSIWEMGDERPVLMWEWE